MKKKDTSKFIGDPFFNKAVTRFALLSEKDLLKAEKQYKHNANLSNYSQLYLTQAVSVFSFLLSILTALKLTINSSAQPIQQSVPTFLSSLNDFLELLLLAITPVALIGYVMYILFQRSKSSRFLCAIEYIQDMHKMGYHFYMDKNSKHIILVRRHKKCLKQKHPSRS